MNSVGWKSVDVSLPDPGSNTNHYDNPSTSKQADRDLEGQPAEGVGLFFGLEVLDGSLYEVKNNKMIFKKLVSETSTKSSDRETEMAKRSSEDVKPMANEACYNLTEQMSGKKRPPQKDADQAKKTNKKKKNNRSLEKTDEAVFGDDEAGEVKGSVEAKAVTKRSGKKKKHKQPSGPDKKDSEQFAKDVVDPAKVLTLQSSWMMSTGGVTLHEKLCEGLVRLGFETPTPIQAATLPAAILGRRNIVGAAATGSGKTLAYVLPIMQHILDHSGDDQTLQALILAPTRELALQVAHECEKLIPKTTGAVVGGLAPHKQVRILDKKRPPIIIGTPGRLWELVSTPVFRG
jgi:ATP-dependent RNA helicase DDX24/MAK5